MDRETFLRTLKVKFIEMVTEVRQRPLDPRAWLALGDVLTIMHLDEEAIECLRWGIALNSMLKEASTTQSESSNKLANLLPSIFESSGWSLKGEEKKELESAKPNWLHSDETLEALWARTRKDSLGSKSQSWGWQAYEAIRDKAIGKVLSDPKKNLDAWLELGKFIEQWEPSTGRACVSIGQFLDSEDIFGEKEELDVPMPTCEMCDNSLPDWQGKIWCPEPAYYHGLISELIVTCSTCQPRGQIHHLWTLESLYADFFWILNCVLEGLVLEDSPRKSFSKQAVCDFMDLAAIYLHDSPASAGWLSRSEGFLLR